MTKQNYNNVCHMIDLISLKINNNPLIPLDNSFYSDLLSWNVYSTPWQQVQGSAINIYMKCWLCILATQTQIHANDRLFFKGGLHSSEDPV